MLSDFVVTAYDRVRPHRFAILVCVGAAFLAVAVFASRFFEQEDIRALIPTEPQRLAENFALLREAPFLRRLTVTVGGQSKDPGALASALADKLRSPEIPKVITGPDVTPSPTLLTRICDFAPSLMTREDVSRMASLLDPEAMGRSLDLDKRELLTPSGLALRELIAKDPLNLRALVFSRLASSAGAGGRGGFGGGIASVENGHVVDATGRYAMLLAEPAAPMSDSVAAARIIERCREAAEDLPEGVRALVIGGHRHTEANAAAVKSDLRRVLPISLLLLAVLFAVFIRTARGVWLFLLPVASLTVAVFVSGMFTGTVSGIVIGFGSVVIGITADYAIHIFFAIRSMPDTRLALRAVALPLSFGAATTLAAFSALLFSAIPAIAQMAVFAMAGVCAAFVLALTVLPHCLELFSVPAVPSAIPSPERGLPVTSPVGDRATFRHSGIAMGLIALASCTAFSAFTVPVDGDIRKLAYTPPTLLADEEETARIWGTVRDGAMVVARGGAGEAGLEEALRVNDAVWRIFADRGLTGNGGSPAVTSLAPFLPSLQTQKTRHADWLAFWRENGDETIFRLDMLSAEKGFSASAFAPFAAWINDEEPSLVTPETLATFGLGQIVDMMRTVTPDGEVLIFTFVPVGVPIPGGFAAELERTGARVVSAQEFREDLSRVTRDDCVQFCLFSFLAIGGMLALFFPSFSRWALAISPLMAGVLAVTAAFRLFGLSMSVFHAAALPLIMGLAADYGIFTVTALERGMGLEKGGAARKAVLLSGLTTLAGFGCLALAKHPALFSLGVTVGAGLGVAMVTALWGIPRMGRVSREKA